MIIAQEQGYLLRCPHADQTRLRKIITAFLPEECWSFGGALLWDVDSTKGQKNLRAITKGAAAGVDITGDFGHAFAKDSEVRWKRRDDGDYDVLLLTETLPDMARQTQLHLNQIAVFPEVVPITDETAMFLAVPRELQEKQLRPRLDYKEYRAANGATQFARYVRYWEKPV
jgi:hypothetical protein